MTGKVRDFIKRMDTSLQRHRFSGGDPVLILEFLRRFVQEADILGMSEAQAFLALPKFLDGTAEAHFFAAHDASSGIAGGLTCWPQAV